MADDPVIFEPKKIPTQVKHWVLERCLVAWGGICINTNQNEVRLAFVDTCCGSGLYESNDEREAAEGIYEVGSALIGPQALAELAQHAKSRGREIKTRALLINPDAKELQTAQTAIFSAAVHEGLTDIQFEARPLQEAHGVIEKVTRDWFSFVFIDPYGPKPTPFSAVSAIVRRKHTDTLINFPFYSFHKWTGFLGKTPSEDQQAKLAAADAFMGGSEWREVARQAEATAAPIDQALVAHYMKQLGKLGVLVLSLPLMFQDINRVMYHLIFTSHNVAGLASAKKQFQEGEDHQYKLRQEFEVNRKKMGFLPFDDRGTNDEQVDVDGLASTLHDNFAGRTVTTEQVILEGLKLKRVLESDVKKALTRLKNDGKVKRDGTRYGDDVTFTPVPKSTT